MKKIELLRFAIFALAAIAMFLAVTHSVFSIGRLPVMLIGGSAFCLTFKFDDWYWPGLPIFLYFGSVAGLLVGLPVYLVYFSMQ